MKSKGAYQRRQPKPETARIGGTRVKITEAEIACMRELREQGKGTREIARFICCAPSSVTRLAPPPAPPPESAPEPAETRSAKPVAMSCQRLVSCHAKATRTCLRCDRAICATCWTLSTCNSWVSHRDERSGSEADVRAARTGIVDGVTDRSGVAAAPVAPRTSPTPELVEKARRMRAQDATIQAISNATGLSHTTAFRVTRGAA